MAKPNADRVAAISKIINGNCLSEDLFSTEAYYLEDANGCYKITEIKGDISITKYNDRDDKLETLWSLRMPYDETRLSKLIPILNN